MVLALLHSTGIIDVYTVQVYNIVMWVKKHVKQS